MKYSNLLAVFILHITNVWTALLHTTFYIQYFTFEFQHLPDLKTQKLKFVFIDYLWTQGISKAKYNLHPKHECFNPLLSVNIAKFYSFIKIGSTNVYCYMYHSYLRPVPIYQIQPVKTSLMRKCFTVNFCQSNELTCFHTTPSGQNYTICELDQQHT